MGYDISITKTEVKEVTETLFKDGCTFNLEPMLTQALERNINRLNGYSAGSCVSILTYAVADMKKNKSKYEKLNPKNGYGDYNDALKVLEGLLNSAEKILKEK